MKKIRVLILFSVIALGTSVFFITPVSAATLYGDLNSNGSVDSGDFTLLRRHLLGISSAINTDASDLNGDGSTNSGDYTLLRRFLLGIINKFPVQNTPTATPTVAPEEETPEKNLIGDIIFSKPSCTFKSQVSVTLSSKITNAQIRYTIDGSVPTNNSSLYNNALLFTSTTQLRAQAFVNGAASGKMGTVLYIASAIDVKHDLPVIIMDDYGKGKPGKVTDTDVAVMVMDPQNNEVSLLQTPNIATRAGFHIRGQSSSNFEKAPYKLEFWDNENEDAKYPILGMPADGDWALLSPYPDKSLIRNALAYELGKSMGLQTPRYSFVEVYLNTDKQPLSADDYQGVYLLTEKIEIGKDRLNIKKLKDDDLTEPNISGGYLMQFNMQATEGPIVKGSGWSDLEVTEPDDLNSQQLTWISNYIQNVHNSIHSTNPSDPQNGYPAYIDVDSFVNFIIENEIGREPDEYIRSTRIYKNRGGKLMAGPLWDYDLAFDCYTGMAGFGSTSTVEGWQFQPMMMMGGTTTCDWYYTLMKDSSFQSKISGRWQELRRGPFSDTELSALVDKLTAPLNNGSNRNFQKWNILSTATVGGFGTQTTKTWQEQTQIVKNFLLKRAAWLDKSGWKPTTTNAGWGF